MICCYEFAIKNVHYHLRYVPRWARLGELNLNSSTDDARPEDYRISEIIIHPNFKKPSFYNNIALYRLEKDVVFSSYIRPICLNTDKLLKPSVATAIGWGITEIGSFHNPCT